MVDYTSNSNASKTEVAAEPKPEVVKVISGDVGKKKKPIGTKFREVFLGADFKGITSVVIQNVLIPGARDLFFDAVTKGAGRMAYGENARRPSGSAFGGFGSSMKSYATAVQRTPGPVQTMPFGSTMFQQQTPQQSALEDYVLTQREDADVLIETMNERLQMFGEISVYDVKKMLGLSVAHTDIKWGWTNLRGAQIKPVREGWLIQLPNPIQI